MSALKLVDDEPPPRSGPDADLVVRSVTDPDLFSRLFDQHAATLYRYCARRAGPDAAEDLVSDTFLVAYERRSSYAPERGDVLPWLYGIVTNLLHRHRRREVRALRAYARTGVDPYEAGHAERSVERADAERLKPELAIALADMPARERDVLLLHAWGDLSYSEIAAALDIPIGTVRSRLSRARYRLRTALGGTR